MTSPTASPLLDALAVRAEILNRLEEDLIGPSELEELLTERPTDRYLTGILYPPDQRVPDDDADESSEAVGGPDAAESINSGVGLARTIRPSSIGLSFRVTGTPASVVIDISMGRYERTEIQESANGGTGAESWKRVACQSAFPLTVDGDGYVQEEPVPGIPGLAYSYKTTRSANHHDVTLVVTNVSQVRRGSRTSADEATFFQSGFVVRAVSGTSFVPRGVSAILTDEDALTSAVLYRDLVEYAAGHTCAARWFRAEDTGQLELGTTWLPRALVPAVSSEGAESFRHLSDESWCRDSGLRPRSARWLADASATALADALGALVDSYDAWIDDTASKISTVEWIAADATGNQPDRVGRHGPTGLSAREPSHVDAVHAARLRNRSDVATVSTGISAADARVTCHAGPPRSRHDGSAVVPDRWR